MSIHAVEKNMYVENVIIDYRDRPEGSESKLNTYSDGMKVLKTIVKLYRTYKPMGFFGAIAILLCITALINFVPVMKIYLETGLVPKFPTLIVCGFMVVTAVQSFFAGLMLQTMMQKNRQDFEMELQRVYEQKKRLLEDK